MLAYCWIYLKTSNDATKVFKTSELINSSSPTVTVIVHINLSSKSSTMAK